ncbi:MAG: hypothetical protein COV67_05570 [Nitrospinae bacterium CG11_big_fil_rev_8_21_14_0_20_56_8]|nr:MAG: hypothetical protein COV67_05570 [Nitrospinae bacterium CG11_big_fil_rev_8_21_14_0_20_56_8]
MQTFGVPFLRIEGSNRNVQVVPGEARNRSLIVVVSVFSRRFDTALVVITVVVRVLILDDRGRFGCYRLYLMCDAGSGIDFHKAPCI